MCASSVRGRRAERPRTRSIDRAERYDAAGESTRNAPDDHHADHDTVNDDDAEYDDDAVGQHDGPNHRSSRPAGSVRLASADGRCMVAEIQPAYQRKLRQ